MASACNFVFLDGSETAGAAEVKMLANFGRITVPLLFKVWFADQPLEIDLSDAKLSQIKQWRVPANTDRSVQTSYLCIRAYK